MRKLPILPLLFYLLLLGCGDGRTDFMRTLLHEQDSLNRAFLPLSLDTIRQLTDYFDHHGTNYDRVHAHYLLGSVYRDMGEAPASLTAFQHAIEVADTTAGGDSIYALLAKIYGQVGDLFQRQYHPTKAIEAYKKGATLFTQLNDTLSSVFTSFGVIGSYKMLNRNDSLLYLTDSLYHVLIGIGDIHNSKRILGLSTQIYLERGDYAKANELLDIYRSYSDSTESGRRQSVAYNYLFGEYYLGVGQLDSAEYHFRKELAEGKNMSNQIYGLRGLYHLYSKKVIVDSLIKYTAAYNDLNDSSNIMRDSEAILNMQSLYDYSRHENEALEKTAEAQRLQKMAIIILAALLLTLFLFWMYRKRKEMRFMTMKMDLLTLRQQLDSHERELEKAEQRNDATKEEIEALKGQIVTLRSEMNRMRPKEDIGKSLRRMSLLNCSMADYEWKDVEDYFSKNDPDFLTSIQGGEDRLSEMESKVCLLIRLGLSNKDMTVLLGCSSQSLSNLRSSLAQKLFGGKVHTRAIDQKIRVFKCKHIIYLWR